MEAAVVALPSGFRFLPTDQEILNYLREERMRIESLRLGFIRYIDLYAIEPWKLWDDHHQDQDQDHHITEDEDYEDSDSLFFFTPLKKKTKNGTRVDRTVVVKKPADDAASILVGTWKFQTKPEDITDFRTGMPMGVKKQATFVPWTNIKDDDHNEHDTTSSSSTSSSGSGSGSKKRKHAPAEMDGTSYIMHEYTLNPYDDQVYSLCRIRRKIIKNKKMKRLSWSSSTTNTTTTTPLQLVVQEERATGYYDHYHQQENNICYNYGQQQQQQEAVLPPEGDVQIISDDDHDKGLANALEEDIVFCGVVLNEEFLSRLEQDVTARAATTGRNFALSYEQEQQQQPVVLVPAEEKAISSEIIHHQEENNIDGLQQQEAVVDVQISEEAYDKGLLADAVENFACYGLSEEFLSLLKQDLAAPPTTEGDLLY